MMIMMIMMIIMIIMIMMIIMNDNNMMTARHLLTFQSVFIGTQLKFNRLIRCWPLKDYHDYLGPTLERELRPSGVVHPYQHDSTALPMIIMMI